jgi:hypothetical protein
MKNFKKLVLAVCVLALAFCFTAAAFGADDETEKYPIDVELERRMDADPSTPGMVEAYAWAEDEWD